MIGLFIEKVAEKYRAKRSLVAWCFSRLKAEGLIGPPCNAVPQEMYSGKRAGMIWQATCFIVTLKP